MMKSLAVVVVGAVGIALGAGVAVFETPSRGQPPELPKEEALKPKWAVGDSWVVETAYTPVTVTARLPAGAAAKNAPAPAPVVTQWKFVVAAQEKLAGADAYRVEATVAPARPGQPSAKLWYDAKAMTLRQVEAQIPAGGEFVTLTESYAVGEKAPTPPAIGPLTALPVELPAFVGGRRGETTFTYESAGEKAGGKRAANDVAFAVSVTQSLSATTADKTPELPKNFARDLTNKPLVRVTLSSPERKVVQLWEAGQPWPSFTTGGPTTSRLVSVSRAAKP